MRIAELKVTTVPKSILTSIPLDRDYKSTKATDLNIGPHEGKEINLMIAGYKGLAALTPERFSKNQTKIKNHGMLVHRMPNNLFFVALPNYENELNLAVELTKDWLAKKINDRRYHISMGKLFGYTNDQIRTFLQKSIKKT